MPSIYEQEIISRYQSPLFSGTRNSQSTHSAEGINLSCGDEVTLWAQIGGDGSILSLKHETRGCAICTASADILCEKWQGKTLGELTQGKINTEQHIKLLQIPLSPLRIKCAALPCHALENLSPIIAQ